MGEHMYCGKGEDGFGHHGVCLDKDHQMVNRFQGPSSSHGYSSKRKDSERHNNLGPDGHMDGFRSKIQRGDHNYTERKNDKYKHHGYLAMTNEPEDMKWLLSNNNVDQIGERVTKTKSKSVSPARKHRRTKLCEKLDRHSSNRKDSERHSNLGPDGHMDGFRSKIQRGDHIYTERKKNKYQHHGIYEGIYEGQNRVIHFQRPSKGDPCKICGQQTPENGGRVTTCLDCFRSEKLCYIIRYKIERSTEEWEKMDDSTWDRIVPGKAFYGYNSEKIYIELCLDNELYAHVQISKKESSKYKVEFDHQIKLSRFSFSKSAEEVISTAQNCKTKPYHLLKNNCEHFAVYCKTDNARSIQVEFPVWHPCKILHRVLARNSSKKTGPKGKGRPDEKIQDQSDSCCLPWFRRGNPYSKLGEPKPQKVNSAGPRVNSKISSKRKFSRKYRKTV